MTAVWQPGTTYIPGSIVKPSTTIPTTLPDLANPGFETGDLTGWTAASGTWTVGGSAYSGSFKVSVTGNGTWALKNNTIAPVTPGQVINASGFARLTNSGTDDQGAEIALYWLDSSHTFISQAEGGVLTGKGGHYASITAEGVAPANAAYVQFVLGAHVTSGGNIDFDAFTWSTTVTGPPEGLVYKATQAAPGKSGATEPTWPGNTTTPVTDNQVTWQGVIATQLVWQAVPINKSGATEPVWPTDPGAAIHDGSIDWVAKTPTVDDPNCPASKIVAIAASKIYAADKDIIRYSATVNPLDWSATNDAGYLPFGLQTFGDNPVLAMNLYRSNLVAFNAVAFQMWQVDEDPANTALLDALPIGSSWNDAMSPVSNDLLFLSSEGVRSIGIAATGVNLQAGDVGMPIDPLVIEAMDRAAENDSLILSTFIPTLGQYWIAFSNYPPDLGISGHLAGGQVGTAVVGSYTLSGGAPPRTVAITSGAAPTGAVLLSSGVWTGTYLANGNFSWEVTLTDSVGNSIVLPDSTTVAAMTLSGAIPDGRQGSTPTYAYSASGGVGTKTYSVLSGSLPLGITLNSDGTISGTFGSAGSFSYTVRAMDSVGNIADAPGTTTVSATLLWDAITGPPDYTVSGGGLVASGANGIFGTIGHASGKFYYEVTTTCANGMIGMADYSSLPSILYDPLGLSHPYAVCLRKQVTLPNWNYAYFVPLHVNSPGTGNWASVADVITVAVDLTLVTPRSYIYVNGVLAYQQDLPTGITWYPCVYALSSGTFYLQTTPAYPPSGFSPW